MMVSVRKLTEKRVGTAVLWQPSHTSWPWSIHRPQLGQARHSPQVSDQVLQRLSVFLVGLIEGLVELRAGAQALRLELLRVSFSTAPRGAKGRAVGTRCGT